MKTVGIKLADGKFYPILKEGSPKEKSLELTTVRNNQTKITVDLYRSEACEMSDAEYVDSLQIENLESNPSGQSDITLTLSLDKNENLTAKIKDTQTDAQSSVQIALVDRTEHPVRDQNFFSNAAETSGSTEPPELAENGVAILRDENPVRTLAHGAGFLATAEALLHRQSEAEKAEKNEPEPQENPQEEVANIAKPADDIKSESETMVDEEKQKDDLSDLDLPDFNLDENPQENDDLPAPDFDFQDDFNTDAEKIPADDEEPGLPETSDSDDVFESAEENPDADTDSDTPETSENQQEDEADNPEASEEPAVAESENTSEQSSGNGLDFSGLYDEEYIPEDEEGKKKSPLPFIVCGLICLLVLFFIIPSKINPLQRNAVPRPAAAKEKSEPVKKPEAESVPEPVPAPEPQPIAAPEPIPEPKREVEVIPEPEPVPEPAVEEIIIIEIAEEVVPQQPPAIAEEPKIILYKVKWGDTLWDIATTYYKNPWRYTEIARHNGLKDPDHIVSGTIIEIPAE